MSLQIRRAVGLSINRKTADPGHHKADDEAVSERRLSRNWFWWILPVFPLYATALILLSSSIGMVATLVGAAIDLVAIFAYFLLWAFWIPRGRRLVPLMVVLIFFLVVALAAFGAGWIEGQLV